MNYTIITRVTDRSAPFTKKQACYSTDVSPGDVCGWADVLHACKIQDDWHEADENKVGASNKAQKECSLSKFGTAQDHLKEHLKTKRNEWTCQSRMVTQRLHLPSLCLVSLCWGWHCLLMEEQVFSKTVYLSSRSGCHTLRLSIRFRYTYTTLSESVHFTIYFYLLTPGYINTCLAVFNRASPLQVNIYPYEVVGLVIVLIRCKQIPCRELTLKLRPQPKWCRWLSDCGTHQRRSSWRCLLWLR